MAVRARPDNLALDHPAVEDGAAPVEFAELWRHREDLQAVCRRVADDESAADDLVQDTFLRALQADGLERRTSLAPWLATVARRRSIDRRRSESRALLVAVPPERSGGGDPLDHVLSRERTDRVQAALAALAPRERRLLMRQVAHDLSLAELAAEEETSIASVRSVLARARTKLRASIERGGPLGAAPLPRLVAAAKRRLHRWAARFEASAPMLAGAGAQLGDVVAAAITAIAVLLAGGVPAPSAPTALSLVAAEQESASPSSEQSPPNGRRPDPDRTPRRPAAGGEGHPRGERDEQSALAVGPPVDPPPVDLPGLPADGADQPEEVYVQHIAASNDGKTLVIHGNKDVQSGAKGGEGLYRSDDGGHTWRWLEAGGYAYGYPVIPPGFERHGTLFVAADPLVLRSDDGGRNFEVVGSSRNGVTALPSDPNDRRIFLAPAGLVAYDAGTKQTTAYSAAPTYMSLGGLAAAGSGSGGPSFVVGTNLYTATGARQGYVQRCTVHACTAPLALPGMYEAPKIVASKATPGLVLAFGSQLLYRSVDGGATFTAVPLDKTGTLHTIAEGAGGELLLARSNRGDTSSSGLLRSLDGGLTWTPLAVDTALQQGAGGLVFLSNGRIVAGTKETPGFRCSVDGGLTWTPRCPA